MTAREANRKELRLQVGHALNLGGNRSILLVCTLAEITAVAILAVRDENHNELFGVWIVFKENEDLLKYTHEVGAATSSDLTDMVIVLLDGVALEALRIVVVSEGVELLKWFHLGIVILLADELSANFECLDGGARHRS